VIKVNRFSLLTMLIAVLLARSTVAAIDSYEFPDDQSRQRYQLLVDELRCPQCLNTNLAGSDSMIAKDLRREIHRLVLEGMSDDEIRDFMYQRYGDFILYRPRMTVRTLLLWFGPVLILAIAIGVFVRHVVARGREESATLTLDDQSRLKELLAQSASPPASDKQSGSA
jgi:cytochrome c-type biogenesis protein CcmH|tara:strand:+ start:8907 stop:9413 length:507 start_codon:yes stop_codon:yes gene_type:complete